MSNSVAPNLPVRESRRALAIEPAVVLVPAGLFVAVVSTAAPSGSYFPSSWGWGSLAFLWAAAIGLLVQRRVTLGALEVAYLGAWLVLLVWTAASLLWSPTTTQTMYEVERTRRLRLVRVRPRRPRTAQRPVPAARAARRDRRRRGLRARDAVAPGSSRQLRLLRRLPAVRAARLLERARRLRRHRNRGRGRPRRPCEGARGASALRGEPRPAVPGALLHVRERRMDRARRRPGRGDRRRSTAPSARDDDPGDRTLAGARPLAGVRVAEPDHAVLCARGRVGRGQAARPDDRRSGGHRGARDDGLRRPCGSDHRRAPRAIRVRGAARPRSRRLLSRPSSRPTEGRRSPLAVRSTRSGSPRRTSAEIRRKRLFSLSSNGRLDTWESALDDARAHPAVGSGAGTFERWWLEHRRRAAQGSRRTQPLRRDARGAGPARPGRAVGSSSSRRSSPRVRARRSPLVAPALAGFVALAVHAGIDWDWEMPAVMIAGLTCAGVLLLANGVPGRGWTLGIRSRGVLHSPSSSRSRCSRS